MEVTFTYGRDMTLTWATNDGVRETCPELR